MTLLQGAIDSVSQFVRGVTTILSDLIPHIALPYIDDIGVKRPRSRYKNCLGSAVCPRASLKFG